MQRSLCAASCRALVRPGNLPSECFRAPKISRVFSWATSGSAHLRLLPSLCWLLLWIIHIAHHSCPLTLHGHMHTSHHRVIRAVPRILGLFEIPSLHSAQPALCCNSHLSRASSHLASISFILHPFSWRKNPKSTRIHHNLLAFQNTGKILTYLPNAALVRAMNLENSQISPTRGIALVSNWRFFSEIEPLVASFERLLAITFFPRFLVFLFLRMRLSMARKNSI